MLSERERLVLNDIERRIESEDPDMVRRFAGSTWQLDHHRKPREQRPYIAAVITSLALMLISIAAGAPIPTLLMVMASGLTFGLWYLRCRVQNPGGPR